MHLGDLGADVVKIEDPRSGDESRRYGPPFVNGESAYFLSVNRNKSSCAVDLKSPAGRDVVIALAGGRRRRDRQLPARERSTDGA